MPRAAKISSTSRRLRLKPCYNHTAWLMISPGKRKPRYGLDVVFMPETLPQALNLRQPDSTKQSQTGILPPNLLSRCVIASRKSGSG